MSKLKDPYKQQKEFTARVVQNLPSLHPKQMQEFIDNPLELQKLLRQALRPGFMFDVTVDDRDGKQLESDLTKLGYGIRPYARYMLYGREVWGAPPGTYTLVVLTETDCPKEERTLQHVIVRAHQRGLVRPPAAVAPYVRELVSNDILEALNLLDIVIMHEPHEEYGWLTISRQKGRGELLCTAMHSGTLLHPGQGYAFVVPKEN